MTGRHIAPLEVAIGSMLIGLIMLTGYVRHALSTERPLIDLRLMRFRTFEAGILGGTFFRFGVGASAFLLPLMLQLGFGLDPLALRSHDLCRRRRCPDRQAALRAAFSSGLASGAC